MDPVGLISLVYDVSKDLYAYCQIAKERDNDIADFRAQLLWLQEKSALATAALKRDGLQSEDKEEKAKKAISVCERAAKTLDDRMKQLKSEVVSAQKTSAKLWRRFKNRGHSTYWPFQKPKVLALLEHVKTCHVALDDALVLVQLNSSASTLQELRRLDQRVIENKIGFEDAMKDIKTSVETKLDSISHELARQTKLFNEKKADDEARHFLDSLRDPDFGQRQSQITESHDQIYDLFANGAKDFPQAADLLQFLQSGNGLFWISGEAASGKSTLMKYIANPKQRGNLDLWQWARGADVTIACHFCWIAGSDGQKSQTALLRSLLYYVLSEERNLVAQISGSIRTSRVTWNQWSRDDLWSCLHTAVKASSRRICVFVDGLDEIMPEAEHEGLVSNLQSLSSYNHVKMVVSSRLWCVFRPLGVEGKLLRMEEINRRAIVDYLCESLRQVVQTSSQDIVDWDCLRERNFCYRGHDHGEVHTAFQELSRKADGNFLWATLVTEQLRSVLVAGFDPSDMHEFIMETPGNITEYFRTMIFERVNKQWGAVMPMALRIAMVGEPVGTWISFWMLRNSTLPGPYKVMQTDPKFAVAIPYVTCNLQQLRMKIQQTHRFLSECCRDILNVQKLAGLERMSDRGLRRSWWHRSLAGITFTHRSVYDFLRTSEMQEFLNNKTPPGCRGPQLKAQLVVARWKLVSAPDSWMFPWMCYELQEVGFADAHLDGSVDLDIIAEAEEVCVHQFRETNFPVKSRMNNRVVFRGAAFLCSQLASHGFHELTDTMLSTTPSMLCRPDGFALYLALDSTDSAKGGVRWINVAFLSKLLQAGMNPNVPSHNHASVSGGKAIPHSWSTPWSRFLERLATNEETLKRSRLPLNAAMPKGAREEVASASEALETFSSSNIQEAILCLLEFGAELQLSPQAVDASIKCDEVWCVEFQSTDIDARVNPLSILRTWLPMDGDSKWPALFETYSQPAKQEEIRQRRERAVKNWPKWEVE